MPDDHGQPLNRRHSGKRLNDRTLDELIGISRGLIAFPLRCRLARLRRQSNSMAESSVLPGNSPTGPRSICEEVVTDRRGIAIGPVTQKMDYLAVGTFCSTDWLHTSYGRKIMKASEQREKGIKSSIISEDHWARAAFSD